METEDDLVMDDAFDLLSNSRRRYLIYYLVRRGGSVELGEMTDQITAWEHDTTVDRISSDQRRRVYISLYQTHLPKLAEHGVLTYDDDEKTVTLADNVDDLVYYLQIDREETSRWGIYYAALSGAGLLLLLFGLTGPFPLSTGTSALLIATSFIALTVIQFAYGRLATPGLPRLAECDELDP